MYSVNAGFFYTYGYESAYSLLTQKVFSLKSYLDFFLSAHTLCKSKPNSLLPSAVNLKCAGRSHSQKMLQSGVEYKPYRLWAMVAVRRCDGKAFCL